MARDSIELNLDEQTPLSGKTPRVRNNNQQSAINIQPEQDDRSFRRSARSKSQPKVARPQDQEDSELLINPDDLDLDELDSEEAQFLRTDRRVPVRRGALPKKAVSQLKVAGAIAAVVVVGGMLSAWAY